MYSHTGNGQFFVAASQHIIIKIEMAWRTCKDRSVASHEFVVILSVGIAQDSDKVLFSDLFGRTDADVNGTSPLLVLPLFVFHPESGFTKEDVPLEARSPKDAPSEIVDPVAVVNVASGEIRDPFVVKVPLHFALVLADSVTRSGKGFDLGFPREARLDHGALGGSPKEAFFGFGPGEGIPRRTDSFDGEPGLDHKVGVFLGGLWWNGSSKRK